MARTNPRMSKARAVYTPPQTALALGAYGYETAPRARLVPVSVPEVLARGDSFVRRPGKEGVALHQLAPPPLIDRYPIIQGSNVTFGYIHSVMRLALTGYRAQMVDLLAEMLDQEPHGFSAISKRTIAIAGGRIEVTIPPDLTDDGEKTKAQEICDDVRRMLMRIPHRASHFATLAWAIYTGIGASEIMWSHDGQWDVTGLQFIHSRRLSYPDPTCWDLFVWDQGAIGIPPYGSYGIRIKNEPGKFLVHAPRLRAEYPTREGLGRILVAYFTIKRIVLRVSAQDFERFVKPWVVAYYCTNDGAIDMPRSADEADIEAARLAMRGLGSGSLAGAVLPDSVKLDLMRAATELDQAKFLDYLDGAISKACVGQTHTAQPGASGSRAAAEVAKEDTKEIARYDAECFADSIEECLVFPYVANRYPGFEHLAPVVAIHTDKPEALSIIEAATKLAEYDAPVDADKIAAQAGVALLPPEDGDDRPRRLRPLSPGASADPVPQVNPDGSPMAPDDAWAQAARKSLPGAQDGSPGKAEKKPLEEPDVEGA